MLPELPYRGIQPYRYVDHPIFFAREQETRDLLSLVIVYRGVMLYGDSGTGKSSLINAGLFAAARREGFQPERIRVQPTEDQELVVERTPADDEGTHLLPSIFAPEHSTEPHIVVSPQAFEERLQVGRGSAWPLLVFDQFEELVTLFEEADRRDLQRAVAELLVRILHNDVLPVKLVLSFREDYLARVKQLLHAAPELVGQSLRLTSPRADDLMTIIRGPFDRYPGAFGREISPGLARTLSERLADRFGSGEVSLSEVQTVCLRLWQSDEPSALLARRGIRGLLEDYLGEELDTYPPALKYAAIALLSQMVTAEGTRNVISAESLIGSVREEDKKIAPELLTQALKRLESESKLVRRERRRDLYLYEITSEFLVPWISAQREAIERLRVRRRERRRMLVFGGAVAVLLAVIALVAFFAVEANDARGRAEKQEGIARASQRRATTNYQRLKKAQGDLKSARHKTKVVLSRAQKANREAHAAAVRADQRRKEAAAAKQAAADATTRARSAQAIAEEKQNAANAAEAVARHQRALARQARIDAGAASAEARLAGRKAKAATLRATRQRQAAREAQKRAASANRLATAQRLAARSLAELSLDPAAALQDAVRAVEARSTDQAESALRQAVAASYPSAVFSGHTDGVEKAAFSPDGKLVVTASWDKTAGIWDARTGKLLRTLGKEPEGVRDAEFSPDGKEIVTGSAYEDWTARIWDTATGSLLRELKGDQGAIRTANYSRDGKYVVTASDGATARIWDARTGALVAGPFWHPTSVRSAALSPDDKLLVTGDLDGAVRIWDVATNSVVRELQPDTLPVNSVAFSPDGKSFAAAGEDATVHIWETATGKLVDVLAGHSATIDTALFNSSGDLMVTGSSDGTARVWDLATGSTVTVLRGHANALNSAAFSADGKSIVTASWDQTARVWPAPQFRSTVMESGQTGQVDSTAFSRDGRWIVTAGGDSVRVWDVGRQKFAGQALDACDKAVGVVQVKGAAFSPDGRLIATGCAFGKDAKNIDEGKVVVRDWRSGTVVRTLTANSAVDSVAFSPDGKLIAAGEDKLTDKLRGKDEAGLVWNWRSRKVLWKLTHHTGPVVSVDFSPDGKRLVSAGPDAQPIVWDVQTGQMVGDRLKGHTAGTNSAAFSADGRLIVTTSNDRTARVWKVGTHKTVAILSGHTGITTSAAFSPNGNVIVTGSTDGTARLWDRSSGGLLAVLPGRMGKVQSVAFAPNGKSIVVAGAGADGTAPARIYPCETKVCGSRAELRALARRELSELRKLKLL